MSMDNVTLFFVLVMVFAAASFFSGGGSTGPRPSRAPRPVSEEMISQVLAMFPDMDRGSVRADLAQTGSVEATIDRILSGRLRPAAPAPASSPMANASSTLATHPSTSSGALRNRAAANPPAAASSSSSSSTSGPRNWHTWIRNPELTARRAAMVEASKAKFLAAIPSSAGTASA